MNYDDYDRLDPRLIRDRETRELIRNAELNGHAIAALNHPEHRCACETRNAHVWRGDVCACCSAKRE